MHLICLSVVVLVPCTTWYISIFIKRITVSVSVILSFCLDAFAQFSRYRAETLQVGRGRPGTGRGGVKIVGVAPERLVGTGRKGVEIVGVFLGHR